MIRDTVKGAARARGGAAAAASAPPSPQPKLTADAVLPPHRARARR
jgi:two-component system chemotaxis response regulator CheB